jgi:hypothetical protein
LATLRVSPNPPAAFSPLAITKSRPSFSFSAGNWAASTSRPGRPITSPIIKIRIHDLSNARAPLSVTIQSSGSSLDW